MAESPRELMELVHSFSWYECSKFLTNFVCVLSNVFNCGSLVRFWGSFGAYLGGELAIFLCSKNCVLVCRRIK